MSSSEKTNKGGLHKTLEYITCSKVAFAIVFVINPSASSEIKMLSHLEPVHMEVGDHREVR